MIGLALALVLTSATDEAALAVPNGIGRVFPAEDVLLPRNAQPLAFLRGALDAPVEVVRVTDTGTTPIAAARVGDALALDPGPLAAGETLSIQAVCSGCDARVFTWTVGDADDVTAPTFAAGAARNVFVQGFHTGGLITFPAGYEVDLDLPLLDEAAVMRLDGAAGALFPDACCGAAPATHLHFFIDGGDERTECFDATARDGAGHETPFAEPLCFELTHDLLEEPATFACTSSSASPVSAAGAAPLALLFALLARLRRAHRARRSVRAC